MLLLLLFVLTMGSDNILQNQWLQLLNHQQPPCREFVETFNCTASSIQTLIEAETGPASSVPELLDILIQEVPCRPCIWKVNSKEYKLRHKRKQAWLDISLKFLKYSWSCSFISLTKVTRLFCFRSRNIFLTQKHLLFFFARSRSCKCILFFKK